MEIKRRAAFSLEVAGKRVSFNDCGTAPLARCHTKFTQTYSLFSVGSSQVAR